ncbi:protein FAR1-RELATED SEQUENCE 5-like [Castanea sativa]|uniref:protein FAR1-RELATED SEQUENCE 5-like n=1 Tax=Castanea sativa TaxID=21020 RepID=UPI003F653D7D
MDLEESDKVICKPSNIEEIEGGCMFVARLENSDENLLNKVVHNADEAYALYNDYALRMGFCIQKGKLKYYNGTKNIKQREFLCSKEGFKLDEDFCKEKYLKRPETRTGCKTFVHFIVENGVWRVSAFNLEDNHKLALQSERHLLRSGRRISKPRADVIDTMVNVGISAKNSYSYLTTEVGGSENVGFTERDCYNHVNMQKMIMISAGDVQSLLNHFKSKHAEDPMFFYTIQVDQEN